MFIFDCQRPTVEPMVSTTPTDLSAAARRTRRLIVDAAIETLGQHQGAALGEIADTAEISRSTLHRHFADRSQLLTAVDEECRRRFDEATTRARITDGSGLQALDRLALEYLGLGSVLSLIFADNALVDPDSWDESGEQELAGLIERGHDDGSIAVQLPVGWVITTLWVLLFGAWQAQVSGAVDHHQVPRLLSRTLRGALAASHGPTDRTP